MDVSLVTTTTAEPAPWFVWNRYPSGIIGAAVKIGHRRMLSIRWARPDVSRGYWGEA